MPLNLRIDLRMAREATLAKRMEAALVELEHLVLPAPPPATTRIGRWFQSRVSGDPHALYRLKRSWVRHPLAYRLMRNVIIALECMSLGPEGWLLVFVTLGFWLLYISNTALIDERKAYLARCEFEDISDEIERRLARRKART